MTVEELILGSLDFDDVYAPVRYVADDSLP